MEKIYLHGGKLHLTEKNKVYKVARGHVLVYLVPIIEEKPGRRMFLRECAEGELIPGFEYNSIYGLSHLGLMALDKSELEVEMIENAEEVRTSFAERIGLSLFDVSEFDEQMIEKYNLNLAKEEGFIYATAKEQENIYQKGLGIIYDLFRKNKLKGKQSTPESGNRLYDTVAYLCDYQGISVVSFTKLKENCGRRFTLGDITRMSHFITREVVLEEKWYKKDSGPVMVYLNEGKKPLACIPVSPNRYVAYDVTESKAYVVDERFAQKIQPKAMMFYRPFPYKVMKAKDLFFFGLKSVYISDIIRFVLLALVGTLIGLLIPYMNEQLYDKFIPMGNRSGLVEICGVILACTIGNATFTIVKNLATFRSMNSMEYSVQSATYDRLFNLPQNLLQQYDSADLAQRAMGISSVYNMLSDVVVKTLLSAVFSLLYLARMFKYTKKLSWTALFVLVACMAIVVWIGIQQTKYEKDKLEKEVEAQSLMHQLLMGIAKIRIAGIENRALYEYLKPYVTTRKINLRSERMTVFVNAFVGGLSTVFSMIFYYIMIKKTISMSIGEFMGFTSAFGSFSSAMLEIVSSLLQVNDVKPVYDFCKPILENLPEFEEDAQMPGNLTGDIEINNVTFAYNEESGPVLKNLSLHVNAGEYVGIVGSSGSGKSTLLKLLLGFDKPQLGKIYYDGKDIDSLDKRELRKKFGVVLQDGGVISGSIYENITITAPNTKLKRVKEVVKEVGLEEDINAMPMGLHTVLSENSGTISGGQKQRILIARAIVGKPKIIFFDEATSALDNVTQAMVVETLEKLKATKIVIAHRLSTVMNCDRIVVLEHGELIEQGTYQELMDKKGRFYELAVRQIS